MNAPLSGRLGESKNNARKNSPLIGILTVKGKKYFRGNHRNFIDLAETGKKLGGLVCVIPCEEIDWEKRTVTGYLPSVGSSRWKKQTLPIPDVIYNRIPNRQLENRPDVRQTLNRLSLLPNVTLFNNGFFNKWELYQILSRYPQLAGLLPETLSLESAGALAKLAEKHPILYLKPVDGKAGKGIMRLEKNDEGYRLKYLDKNNLRSAQFSNVPEMWKMVKKLLENQAYLVQQGIRLAKYQGSIFDVRLLAQKNGSGAWEVAGIGIRVAGKGKITTHVPRGGRIADPRGVLGSVFGGKKTEQLLKEARKIAIQIVSCLEEQFGHLGEASMDLGVDEQGKFWFFEANAKPMKFDEPHIRRRSLHNIIAYSMHLAGYNR